MRFVRCLRHLTWALLLAPVHLTSAKDLPRMAMNCLSVGDAPRLQCVVSLHDAQGNPLTGAKLMLRAHMPSMPMAHSVQPVAASATVKAGEYEGTLQLEMPGRWAVQVDLSHPRRYRWIQSLQASKCDRPCVAQLIHPK